MYIAENKYHTVKISGVEDTPYSGMCIVGKVFASKCHITDILHKECDCVMGNNEKIHLYCDNRHIILFWLLYTYGQTIVEIDVHYYSGKDINILASISLLRQGKLNWWRENERKIGKII